MRVEPPGDPGDDPVAASVPTLHVVLLAHLDTQWRWTERDTIAHFLPATVDANEALFERFPFYVLSFEGAYRYQLLAEHDPARFERVATRVREGRWHVAGPPLDAFDANLPSPESILRHCLYGSRWLERQLGVVPRELLLPDCFGFPASLPTLAAHAGLGGFSTQKLRKGPEMRAAFGVPFAYGIWRGPDGSEVLAALDPGEYGKPPSVWPGDDPAWREAFGAAAGRPPRRMAYFGVGDKGGALAAEAVARLDPAGREESAIRIAVGPSDAIYAATSASERGRLPRHSGDLLLRQHGVGCYTAQGGMKRWNRANERLARAAEMAATLAWRLGRPYPAARLERAWTRFLVRQMHDDLTGTAIPATYRLSYGDEALAANDFAETLLDSLGEVARALDRSGEGTPLLVFEPYAGARALLVEVELAPGEIDGVASVRDPEGEPLPFQVERREDGSALLLVAFESRGAGASLLRLSTVAAEPRFPPLAARVDDGGARLAAGGLESRFDERGDLERFAVRGPGREPPGNFTELLAAPVRLELLPDRPRRYPAWEIEWRDHSASPRARVGAPRRLEVIENGPLRASVRVTRGALGSRFVETWRMAAGASWLEVETEIDWRTRGALLVASVATTSASDDFLCDLGVGVASRPLADERLYEVPAFRWSALAGDGTHPGVALLCDERAGRSHPDPRTLRLTLVHSPATIRRFPHQAVQDFGRQRVRWALAPLPPERAAGAANALAESFATPPIALVASSAAAPGVPGRRRLACADLGARAESLVALKRAEGSQRLLLRLRETAGEVAEVELTLPDAVLAVEELDATERPIASASPPPFADAGRLTIELSPWTLRTLAIDVGPSPPPKVAGRRPLGVHGTRQGFTRDGEPARAGFDGRGRCFPAELTPLLLQEAPVAFDLAPVHGGGGVRDGDGGLLEVPSGFAELWWLGAAAGSRALPVRFRLDGRELAATFPSWRTPLAAPDRRLLGGRLGWRTHAGWARRAPLAWYATHLHDRRGRNLAGERGMLFAVPIPLDGAGGTLRLPEAPELRLVAATLVREPARPVREMRPLFDTFE